MYWFSSLTVFRFTLCPSYIFEYLRHCNIVDSPCQQNTLQIMHVCVTGRVCFTLQGMDHVNISAKDKLNEHGNSWHANVNPICHRLHSVVWCFFFSLCFSLDVFLKCTRYWLIYFFYLIGFLQGWLWNIPDTHFKWRLWLHWRKVHQKGYDRVWRRGNRAV